MPRWGVHLLNLPKVGRAWFMAALRAASTGCRWPNGMAPSNNSYAIMAKAYTSTCAQQPQWLLLYELYYLYLV